MALAGGESSSPTVYDSTLAFPAGAPVTSAIDVDNDIAYYGVNTSPATIYKVALNSDSTAAPTIIGSLTLATGENSAKSIALDLVNG